MQFENCLRAIQCIDLTSLEGNDTSTITEILCRRSANPISKELTNELVKMGLLDSKQGLKVASVCLYPTRAFDCTVYNIENKVPKAVVAGGFPSGQYPYQCRLQEVLSACEYTNELDIVIHRPHALRGNWETLYEELSEMFKQVKLEYLIKVILEVGELETLENIYKASWAAMLSGADFIKTSTGKATINATLPAGAVMIRAIKDFEKKYNKVIGFKPAGGIRTEADCHNWLTLMEFEFGSSRIRPEYFRIGASSLLNELEKSIFRYVFHRNPKAYELSI